MQVVPKAQYEFAPMSFISLLSQKTCDASHPENVHKEFKLAKGESGTIILETTIPSEEDMKVWAIIVTKCGGDMKPDNRWISDFKDGGDVATLNYESGTTTGCVQPLYDEDLKDSLFVPTQSEIDASVCVTNTDCCKVTDYRVGCVREDVFEDNYGIETTGFFRDILDDDKGICVAKETNGGFDLSFFTDDSIIPGFANWILFLAILLILMVIGGRKR